jgi:hypothetical protein
MGRRSGMNILKAIANFLLGLVILALIVVLPIAVGVGFAALAPEEKSWPSDVLGSVRASQIHELGLDIRLIDDFDGDKPPVCYYCEQPMHDIGGEGSTTWFKCDNHE